MNTLLSWTRHARTRCQQRCIPPLISEWLIDYGTELHSHGDVIRVFDKSARKRLASAVGRQVLKCMAKYLDTYMVEANGGQIITVGHRYDRIRRSN